MTERDAMTLAAQLYEQTQASSKPSRQSVDLPFSSMRRMTASPSSQLGQVPAPSVGNLTAGSPKFHIEPLGLKRRQSPSPDLSQPEPRDFEKTKVVMLKPKKSPFFTLDTTVSKSVSVEPLLQRPELWPNPQNEDSRELAFNDLYYKHRKLQLHYSVCQILLKVGLELQAQMQEMVRLLVEKFSLSQCHMFLLSEETPADLISTASFGNESSPIAALPLNCAFKPGHDSLVGKAWREKRDLMASSDHFNQYCVPIMHQNSLQGLLDLYFAPTHSLSVEEQLTLKTVCAQLSSYLEEYRKYRQAQQMAITDGLTRLYNHRHFQECFEQAVQQAAECHEWVSLILVDLDYFKQINDTHGHLQGDKVLRQIAQVIKRTVRDHDIVARYGGEEFAILLNNSDLELTRKIAERVLENISREEIRSQFDVPMQVTASLGVIAIQNPNPHQREELIALADEALYEVKRNGRNGFKMAEVPAKEAIATLKPGQTMSKWSQWLQAEQQHLLQEWLRLVENYAAPTVTQAAVRFKPAYPHILQAISKQLSDTPPALMIAHLLPEPLHQQLVQGQTGLGLIDVEITLLLLKDGLQQLLQAHSALTNEGRLLIEKATNRVLDTLNDYLITLFR